MCLLPTDYTCVPFTEESNCDLYVTPSPLLSAISPGEVFLRKNCGRWASRCGWIFPMIPSRKTERGKRLTCRKTGARRRFPAGAWARGLIINAVRALSPLYLKQNADCDLNILCGNNEALFDSVEAEFAKNGQITPMHSTNKMALYLKASDVFISKPGGLSSTESAVGGRAACAHFADTGVRKPQRGVFCQGGYRRKGGKHRNRAFVGGGKAFWSREMQKKCKRQRAVIN